MIDQYLHTHLTNIQNFGVKISMMQLPDLDISVYPLSRNENVLNAVMNNFLVVKSVIICLNYCFWKLNKKLN